MLSPVFSEESELTWLDAIPNTITDSHKTLTGIEPSTLKQKSVYLTTESWLL